MGSLNQRQFRCQREDRGISPFASLGRALSKCQADEMSPTTLSYSLATVHHAMIVEQQYIPRIPAMHLNFGRQALPKLPKGFERGRYFNFPISDLGLSKPQQFAFCRIGLNYWEPRAPHFKGIARAAKPDLSSRQCFSMQPRQRFERRPGICMGRSPTAARFYTQESDITGANRLVIAFLM